MSQILYQKGYQRQEIIDLFHFIDWIMSLPEKEDKLFYKEFNKFEKEKDMRYVTSVERIMREEIEEEAKRDGKSVKQVLIEKFEEEKKREGKEEGKEEVVLKLLREGLSLDLISRATDFSLTEIQSFQSEVAASKLN